MTKDFFESYRASMANLETLQNAAQISVVDALDSESVLIHGIHSRLKTPESLMRKLRGKGYEDPWHELTDIIGVRVILYYNDHVDLAVAAIKKNLGWSRQHTIDKTESVGSKEFSYRSFHIVTELPRNLSPGNNVPEYFEIQVRSVLAHTWAEIEHEIVYKSGIESPDIVRRFSAISGTLEILDREFIDLRESLWKIVARHKDEYARKKGGAELLDSARLIAAMSVYSSGASGWQTDRKTDSWVVFDEVKGHLDALRAAGIVNWNSLRSVFSSTEFGDRLMRYAAEVNVPSLEVDHRAMVQIAALLLEPKILTEFSELFKDAAVLKVMQGA